MKEPAEVHRLEDWAVRVMYFFNTMDTFLPFSVLLYLAAAFRAGFPAGPRPPPAALLLSALAAAALFLALRLADFHPLLAPFLAAGLVALLASGRLAAGPLAGCALAFFAFTSLVQIAFMGIPMSLAARSPAVPLRMYLNSFAIIAPTTMSLPLTVGYQVFLASAASALAVRPDPFAALFLAAALAAALAVRRLRKRGFVPGVHHPPPGPPRCDRVVIFNVDGLSQRAFEKGDAPFLSSLADRYASVAGGARTVYRALTNPAFASILSGVEPSRHGVVNNNSRQPIRVPALPDLVPARLYGSMHVKHFSRPAWAVSIVSLVELGYRSADRVLLGRLSEDLLRHRDDVRLWVVDLSEVDYCGHAWGSYSRQMAEAVRRVDGLARDFWAGIEAQGLAAGTLLIVSSDHGLYIGEHSFILHPAEERVPLIFAGPAIRRARIAGEVSIIDIAANVSYALGAPYCAGSRGRVFPEIFAGPPAPLRSTLRPPPVR